MTARPLNGYKEYNNGFKGWNGYYSLNSPMSWLPFVKQDMIVLLRGRIPAGVDLYELNEDDNPLHPLDPLLYWVEGYNNR